MANLEAYYFENPDPGVRTAEGDKFLTPIRRFQPLSKVRTFSSCLLVAKDSVTSTLRLHCDRCMTRWAGKSQTISEKNRVILSNLSTIKISRVNVAKRVQNTCRSDRRRSHTILDGRTMVVQPNAGGTAWSWMIETLSSRKTGHATSRANSRLLYYTRKYESCSSFEAGISANHGHWVTSPAHRPQCMTLDPSRDVLYWKMKMTVRTLCACRRNSSQSTVKYGQINQSINQSSRIF